jgi:hypothetical protein
MPLNPLSVFDHMTISMDRSMYRKHNTICLYRIISKEYNDITKLFFFDGLF